MVQVVLENLLKDRAAEPSEDAPGIDAIARVPLAHPLGVGSADRDVVRQQHARDELHREDALRAQLAMHGRHVHATRVQRRAQPFERRRLAAVVELLGEHGAELPPHVPPPHERRHPQAVEEPEQPADQEQLALQRLLDERPPHLDGDETAVGQAGAMHLTDRRRGNRLQLEAGEYARDRDAEIRFDPLSRQLALKGLRAILERGELVADRRVQQIDAQREQLPDLDPDAAQALEHGAEALAACPRVAVTPDAADDFAGHEAQPRDGHGRAAPARRQLDGAEGHRWPRLGIDERRRLQVGNVHDRAGPMAGAHLTVSGRQPRRHPRQRPLAASIGTGRATRNATTATPSRPLRRLHD